MVSGDTEVFEPASDPNPRVSADNDVCSAGARRCCESARQWPSIDIRVEAAFVDAFAGEVQLRGGEQTMTHDGACCTRKSWSRHELLSDAVSNPQAALVMLAHPGERIREGQPIAWLRVA